MWIIYLYIDVVRCNLPGQPINGKIKDYESYNNSLPEGSNITFFCDYGFLLIGENTSTCNSSGEWSTDPAMIECHETKQSDYESACTCVYT